MGVIPVLLEQPVHRDDWEGLDHVNHFGKAKYGVSVAADESCQSLADVKKIVEGELADVINVKLAKVGVLCSLEIIKVARTLRLNLILVVWLKLAIGFALLGAFKKYDHIYLLKSKQK
ncbi:hypothetical protein SLEP1_g50590 [Rubroshorea leprosula]|uniref:Enolase C-terminal domain-containing protein n=1 Tax=Rubroshorea leprosula TaxID=152421 RepID=A0AAV5M1F5_9ROSI|nr:hypothetical protein SLEP1_g50590 [Rubroshorea leprosula]